MRTILVLLLTVGTGLQSQTPTTQAQAGGYQATTPQEPLDYVCPMDPDVRSSKPGKCPRCGMTLRLEIPDEEEYSLELMAPADIRAGEKTRLHFIFKNPKSGSIVQNFEVVHEKLFHMFIVGDDLKYFEHEHPIIQPDGSFIFDQVFPKAGMYRVVADVYPSGGMPQLLVKTVFASDPVDPNRPVSLHDVVLRPDEGLQHGTNTNVELVTDPAKPIAGTKTHVYFKFNTAEHMQKYLGAWAHMLIVSDDMVDLIHEHPFIADGGNKMQFDIIFPRPHTYRVWIQFQRDNTVNTVAVNIPVITLEQSEGIGSTGQ